MMHYLWWPDGNLDAEIQEYRMTVHLFGAVSSPSCANYALRKTAHDTEGQYSEEVTSAIQQNFYVDDFLKSVPTEDEAINLVQEICQALAKGGFHLTKWLSNSRAVLQTIPNDERAKEIKDLDLNSDLLPVERALGVKWCVETDQLKFGLKEVNPKATRRNILSALSSVYDPLGVTSPYVLQAKAILQSLCRKRIGWDEQIPEEDKAKWDKWLKDLPNLDSVRVNRCFRPKEFGKVVTVQLHHFADASQDGYGTVTYLRSINEKNHIHCEFVSAKARVAPLKAHTIVKMELTAATAAVRQNDLIQREMKIETNKTVFWTDSQTVLKYIGNNTSRYPVFVANRLAVIHDGSDYHQWRYVPSNLNPADHASRGLSAKELMSKPEWLGGPNFLSQPEESWPGTEGILDEEDDGEAADEHVAEVNVNATVTSDATNPMHQLIHHYSTWTKLKRAVAWWLRLQATLKHIAKNDETTPHKGLLTMNEVQNAERAIIRYVQKSMFPKEIQILSNLEMTGSNKCPNSDATGKNASTCKNKKTQISKESPLRHLDPELQDGLLKVGGRLRNANIPENSKHQLILPKDHHVSKLIIRHIHQQVGHQGRNHVLAELRQKYWIIRAGVAVRSLLNQCVMCRKYKAKTGKQKMADLPALYKQTTPLSHTLVWII